MLCRVRRRAGRGAGHRGGAAAGDRDTARQSRGHRAPDGRAGMPVLRGAHQKELVRGRHMCRHMTPMTGTGTTMCVPSWRAPPSRLNPPPVMSMADTSSVTSSVTLAARAFVDAERGWPDGESGFSVSAKAEPGDNPLYHPVSSAPSLPSRAGDQGSGAELVFGPGVSHRRTRRSPPGCTPGRGPGGRCSMTLNRRRGARACATRSDRPDSSAKPAGLEAPRPAAPAATDWLLALNVAAGPRRAAGSGSGQAR